MLENSLYAYVWQTSRGGQIRICLLVAVVAPLAMAPLELQRRIMDQAIGGRQVWLLALLAVGYLAVVLLQGGLKYVMNVTKGRVLEEVSRDLRRRILRHQFAREAAGAAAPPPHIDEGTTVSMLAAEAEDIGGFASESLAVPLLQGATMIWVLGYLMWIEPRIAALALVIYTPQIVLVPGVQAMINRLSRNRTSLVRKLGRASVQDKHLRDAEQAVNQRRTRVFVEQIYRVRMLIYRRKFFLTFLGNFLDALGPIAVLSFGGYLVIQGRAEVGTLVVFITGFQRLADPWDQIVNFYRSVSNARVAFRLVTEALGETGAHPHAALGR